MQARLCIAALMVGTMSACVSDRTADMLPWTPRGNAVDTIGGREVANPYAWLEELESDSVRAWASAQDAYTMAALSPALDASRSLGDRLIVHAEMVAINTPVRRGSAFFFMVDSSASASPTLQLNTGGEDRLLVDPGDFRDVGMDAAQIADFRVSTDGEHVAVVGMEPSSGRRVMRIINTASRKYLPDAVEDVRLGNAPWTAGDESIVYSTRSGDRPAAVWRHDIGADSDVRLYPVEGHEDLRLAVDATDEGLLVVERRQPNSYQALWLGAAAPDEPEVILGQDGGRVVFMGAIESVLFFYIIDPDGGERIVSARRLAGGFATKAVLELSDISVTTAHLVGGRVVINGGSGDGTPVIRVYGLDGTSLTTLTPPFGLLWTNFPANRPPVFGDWDVPYAYFNSLSLDAPGIYEIDLAELTMTPWRLQGGGTSGDIVLKRLEYTSADGVMVPMSLVHRADTVIDGNVPTLAWIYGAHGFTATPYFSGFFRTFIDAGGVLAMPQVRGGGVHGPEWHSAGSRANKRNTVADTIAAFEWLIDHGVTRPERLAALGNSAGTVPVAAAAIDRPELIGAIILEMPLSDMARHTQWRGGWATEFGDPNISEELDAILEFSPYQKLLQARSLPATLIFAGENDKTAFPHHAFKLAASMQYAQTGEGPVYLRLVRGAGHQIGVNKLQRTENQALELAFLTREIGLPVSLPE